jgi:hypothetical protein
VLLAAAGSSTRLPVRLAMAIPFDVLELVELTERLAVSGHAASVLEALRRCMTRADSSPMERAGVMSA